MLIFAGSFPRRILFGRGALEKLPDVLSELTLGDRVMIVTGRRFARESGYLDKLQSILKSAGISKIVVFDRVKPNPPAEIVEEGGKLARNENIDFVVGFGGGSAMDAAKGIAVLATHEGRLREYYYPNEPKPPILPIVAIPTTCGTGSEVTKYAIFSENLRKNVMLGEHIVPVIAILDPNILDKIPRELLAHTAMDALSHALESYFHVKASDFSEMFSSEAAKIILDNFRKAYDEDRSSKEKLFYASMLAGIAINFTGTVIPHGLGYYLTEKFGLSHGLATSLFLTQFIEYVSKKIPERMLSLCDRLGIKLDDPSACAKALIERIDSLRSYANLPTRLREAGILEAELGNIIENGLSYKRNLENCIAPPTPDDIEEIIRKAF